MIVLEETLPIKLPGIITDNWRKWDYRFLGISKEISGWSKDPSTKVGAIAVNESRRIVAQGYNGFPSGCNDEKCKLDDRLSKYEWTIHAEANTIYNACNSGTNLLHSTVHIFGMYPCPECVKAMSQVKVARIVFQIGRSDNLVKWKNDFDLSRVMMHDLGIGFSHYQDLTELKKGLSDYQKKMSPTQIARDIVGFYSVPPIGEENNPHYLQEQVRVDLEEKISMVIRRERGEK